MRFSRALLASLAFGFLTTLFLGGIAWGVEVESRSQAPSWGPEEAAAPATNASLDLMKKMEFLQQEVQELRGKVEEQAYHLQQMQDQQKKLYLDLDKRVREGNPTKSPTAGITLDEGAKPEQAVSDPVAGQLQNEEKAYQTAYHLIQNKDYEGALVAFKSLVQNFPKGKYLPNANYWMGEIYMVKGNLDLAAQAFNNVYTNYPQHPKAADSLLKLGYVEYTKGQWQRSKELLSQVKNQFPGSTSAQLAEARLQKMGHEGHI